MKAHQKCHILAHSKFMETHFGPNEPAAFCAQELYFCHLLLYFQAYFWTPLDIHFTVLVAKIKDSSCLPPPLPSLPLISPIIYFSPCQSAIDLQL
jgi:hypothetical protein